MSWFSKFFGKTNTESSTPNNQSTDTMTEDNVNVLEGLFVNNNPPAQSTEPGIENIKGLKDYLEQDFYRKGFDDGYNGHSAELLESKIRSMKSDFRYNFNLKIDETRQEILKLENHKIDLEGMSERLIKQIENRVTSLKAVITELEAEIALSALEEGLAMIAINQYRDGFIQGTEAYQDEKLFASSTGMFK